MKLQAAVISFSLQNAQFYQLIMYIWVTMRCARTAAGQCTYRSPWVSRVYFSPTFLRLWQLLITVR